MAEKDSAPGKGASLAWDAVYGAAGVLLLPYFAYRRMIKGKRSQPLGEKFGNGRAFEAGVPRVWIHAVSVGEVVVAETLIKAIREGMPGTDVVLSTTTTTGREAAVKKLGAEKVFCYPADFTFAVRKTLDRVRPSVIVLMELEVWPNLTAEAQARGIPVIVANGRISARAYKRYQKGLAIIGPAFKRVDRWLAQSEEYADRILCMGVSRDSVEIAGNIKYDAVDTRPPDPAARLAMRAELGIASDAPVIIGGSTHPSEEETLLSACAELRGKHPGLRLILVPRHPERVQAVENAINDAKIPGWGVLRRSSIVKNGLQNALNALPPDRRESPVILVDTLGELKRMYAAANAAFVGGSLIPHGGQNVMEPCGMGVPALHGPHMHNFADAMEILRGCNGSVQVTRETLAAELARVLDDPQSSGAMAQRARDAFIARQGATKRTIDVLREYIKTSAKA